MVFFTFPEDARRSSDCDAVEFSVILGPYEGTVRIVAPGLPASPRPVADARAVYGGVPLQRTRFELSWSGSCIGGS